MMRLKSDYSKNLLISVFGVGAAAIIPLLVRPFLGRMFTPEEFNLMGLYLASVAILGVLGNLRYGYAVAVAKTDEDALNLLVGSLILSFFISLLLAAIVFFTDDFVVAYFELDKNLLNFSMLIPVGVFSASSCIAINGWLNRKKKFASMATNKIARRGSESIFHLMAGKIKMAGGLFYGALFGDLINLIVHWIQFKLTKQNLHKISRTSVKSTLKKYSDYPKYNLLPAVLDIGALYLPIFILNSKFTPEVCGQFFQSRDLLGLPVVLVAATLSQVLLQKLTSLRDEGKNATSIFNKHLLLLSACGMLGVLVIAPFGENLFVFFVGDNWGMAGEISSVMVIAFAFRLAISPLSVVFFVYDKLKTAALFQLTYFVSVASTFFLPEMSIISFVWILVLIEVLSYSFYLLLMYRVIRNQ